jgi:hypothetical protein
MAGPDVSVGLRKIEGGRNFLEARQGLRKIDSDEKDIIICHILYILSTFDTCPPH